MRVLDLAAYSEKFAQLAVAEAVSAPTTQGAVKALKLRARSLVRQVLPQELYDELAAFVTRAGAPAKDPEEPSAKRRRQEVCSAPTAILLRNLVPASSTLPPTPNGSWARQPVALDGLGAQWLLGIGALDPRFLDTDILPSDVVPRPGKEHVLGNEGSLALLGWHRDGHFNRDGLGLEEGLPSVLSLFCLRADHDGVAVTGVCSGASALNAVSEADQKLLREEPLLWELTQVAEGKGSDEGSGGLPLVVGDGEDVTVRMLEFMPQGSAAALHAHGRLLEAVEAQKWPVKLQPGDLILVDNYRAMHSRSCFQPRFDGNDRWLQRLSW